MIPGAFPIIAGKPNATVVWTESAASASVSSPETFAGISFSTADASRQIFVATYYPTVSAVTIGGVSATSVATAASNTLRLWRAAVPTGTSGSVVLTFTGGSGRALISAWAAYNLESLTPFDTASYDSGSPATSHTTSINTAGGGVLIAACGATVAVGETISSWTGPSLSNNRVLNPGGVSIVLSAADSQNNAAATGSTLRATLTASENATIVGASFR